MDVYQALLIPPEIQQVEQFGESSRGMFTEVSGCLIPVLADFYALMQKVMGRGVVSVVAPYAHIDPH